MAGAQAVSDTDEPAGVGSPAASNVELSTDEIQGECNRRWRFKHRRFGGEAIALGPATETEKGVDGIGGEHGTHGSGDAEATGDFEAFEGCPRRFFQSAGFV